MLKFQVYINEKSHFFDIIKTATIAEFKALIAEQLKITTNFDLYIFDQLLFDEGTVNRIIYNQSTDHLLVKFREKIHLKKFQSFFKQAIPLIQFKTGVTVFNLKEKISHQIKEQNQQIEQVAEVLSFTDQAHGMIKKETEEKFQNFNTKIQGQTALSHIRATDEDQARNPNNDTVLNILDDMKELDERINHHKKALKSDKKKYQTPKLSPKQEEYVLRKQKAINLLKDPIQYEKAKQLVKDMKKQKELNYQKKQEKYDRSAEKIEQSIEYYKQEKDLLIQKLTEDKRNKIIERLLENQKSHQISLEFNKQSQQQINELKNKIKKQQDFYKSKDDQLKQLYYEEAKLKLQEKRKQAQPIRLTELNVHEEQYLENREMLKLQRDQKKLEWEIKIKSETKQMYRDQRVLQEVLKVDQEIKNKENSEQKKKQEFKIRKQKYSEIIQEFHRPINQSMEQKNSIDDNQLSYSKEKQFNKKLRYQNKSQIADSLAFQAVEKNIKKIQSALSQQHITPKTKITENLQQGKVPDPSTYFHLRVHTPQKMVIQDSNQKKPKDYLREFERERHSLHNPDYNAFQEINKKMNPQQHLRYVQKLEDEAKKKEKLAKVCQNEDLQIEATDLYLKSVQAKLQFLDKNLSHF